MAAPHADRPPSEAAPIGALRRFPLVARPRLPCASLDTRVNEIVELADAATSAADPAALVAVAHNKAALIASDLGLPQLARELCWRHYNRYTTTHPWTARHARLALEPLINLARLDIRHGRADEAITALTALWCSVNTGEEAVIDGHTVDINDLPRGGEDHQTIRLWLWTLLLSEGLRALAAAGRWHDALTHAERHRGIGRRLLDGRQVAILAHAATGDHDLAARLITESDTRMPWERAVAAALTTTDPRTHSARPARIATMVDRYLDLDLDARHTGFSVRLGLAVVDLAGGLDHPDAARAAQRVRAYVTSTNDAYAARDVINHPLHTTLTPPEKEQVQKTLHGAGLHGPHDQTLEHRLITALSHCPPTWY